MFKLTDETREAIVAILRDKFGLTQTDAEINAVIDEKAGTESGRLTNLNPQSGAKKS